MKTQGSSSVEEYLKNLEHLEVREFCCPNCNFLKIEIIYRRANPSWIDCPSCKSSYCWEWNPPRLFSKDREENYSINLYKLIDDY